MGKKRKQDVVSDDRRGRVSIRRGQASIEPLVNSEPLTNSFGDALISALGCGALTPADKTAAMGELSSPHTETTEIQPSSVVSLNNEDHSRISKAVLQRTRAGRAGRWGIRILLTPPQAEKQLEELAGGLRKGLGTGAQIKDGVITVQGDIADRVADWLTKRGVKKIVL